jgi:hypothetical protein
VAAENERELNMSFRIELHNFRMRIERAIREALISNDTCWVERYNLHEMDLKAAGIDLKVPCSNPLDGPPELFVVEQVICHLGGSIYLYGRDYSPTTVHRLVLCPLGDLTLEGLLGLYDVVSGERCPQTA